MDGWAADEDEVAERVAAVEHFLNSDEAASDEASDSIACGAAKVAGESAKLEAGVVPDGAFRGECGEALDDSNGGLVSQTAGELAEKTGDLVFIDGEVDVVFRGIATTRQDAVVDESLDRGSAAGFFREEVEREWAIGGDEGTECAAASRGASAFDSIGGGESCFGGDGEADDFGDTGAAAWALELVATFGQPSADQDAEGGVETAGGELGLDGAFESTLLLKCVGERGVEHLLAFRQCRGSGVTGSLFVGIRGADQERLRALASARRKEKGVRLPGRGEVVVLEPVGKLHTVRGDPWDAFDGWFERTDLGGVVTRGVERAIDDDALECLATEGGVDDLAGCDFAIEWYGVGESEEGGAAGVDGDADVAGTAFDGWIPRFGVGWRHGGAIIRTIVRIRVGELGIKEARG